MDTSSSCFFLSPKAWSDTSNNLGYSLLDSGEGMKLERFGAHTLVRPELSAIWHPALSKDQWDAADGIFHGGGEDEEQDRGKGWQFKKDIEPRWHMQWQHVVSDLSRAMSREAEPDITFFVEPTPFRHVGVFPEQASQWEWISGKIKKENRPVKVLNLFGYTGIASLVAAAAGAEVTHVDASKKIIAWARENQKLSRLEDRPIRWIVDDALKFVKREVRRGATYDGFIIDPPKFGRGPKGEIWHIYEHLPMLLDECQKLFSDNVLFINLTCYAIRITPLSLRYALEERLTDRRGTIEQGELTLHEQSANRLLPQAVCARWSA